MRHHIGRMRRMVYAFSRKLYHHRAAVAQGLEQRIVLVPRDVMDDDALLGVGLEGVRQGVHYGG